MFNSMESVSVSSPSLPFTSDPALHGDWEDQLNPLVLPSSTNSDDFEALHIVHEETIARKNKEGVVIQHRAWPLREAFRSEADYPTGKLVPQN
jgi:chromosome transmission fidelity protein 18